LEGKLGAIKKRWVGGNPPYLFSGIVFILLPFNIKEKLAKKD